MHRAALLSAFFVLQVRIRESNFHSSLIQGAQNFDRRNNHHPKDPTPKTAVNELDKQQNKDNKMPVEQLTSHVLSSAAGAGAPSGNHLAVNTFLICALILIQMTSQ